MAFELIYTSVPQGIRPGTSGFCIAAYTNGLAANLALRLEGFSAYKPCFPHYDANASANPVSWTHYFCMNSGQECHVLSRTCFYGLDYTRRSNKLAHHLVLRPEEVAASKDGPAAVFHQSGAFRSEWKEASQLFPHQVRIQPQALSMRAAETWQKYTGDAGWAGVLAESFLEHPEKPAFIIFDPLRHGACLALVEEALLLLPPEKRWRVSFNTYLTTLPAGVECHWRFCVPGSDALRESRSIPGTLVIDLTKSLPGAGDSPLREAARTGKFPVAPAPVPSREEKAADRRTATASGKEDSWEAQLRKLQQQSAPSGFAFQSEPQTRRRIPVALWIVTPLILLLGVGVFCFWKFLPKPEEAVTIPQEEPLFLNGPTVAPEDSLPHRQEKKQETPRPRKTKKSEPVPPKATEVSAPKPVPPGKPRPAKKTWPSREKVVAARRALWRKNPNAQCRKGLCFLADILEEGDRVTAAWFHNDSLEIKGEEVVLKEGRLKLIQTTPMGASVPVGEYSVETSEKGVKLQLCEAENADRLDIDYLEITPAQGEPVHVYFYFHPGYCDLEPNSSEIKIDLKKPKTIVNLKDLADNATRLSKRYDTKISCELELESQKFAMKDTNALMDWLGWKLIAKEINKQYQKKWEKLIHSYFPTEKEIIKPKKDKKGAIKNQDLINEQNQRIAFGENNAWLENTKITYSDFKKIKDSYDSAEKKKDDASSKYSAIDDQYKRFLSVGNNSRNTGKINGPETEWERKINKASREKKAAESCSEHWEKTYELVQAIQKAGVENLQKTKEFNRFGILGIKEQNFGEVLQKLAPYPETGEVIIRYYEAGKEGKQPPFLTIKITGFSE